MNQYDKIFRAGLLIMVAIAVLIVALSLININVSRPEKYLTQVPQEFTEQKCEQVPYVQNKVVMKNEAKIDKEWASYSVTKQQYNPDWQNIQVWIHNKDDFGGVFTVTFFVSTISGDVTIKQSKYVEPLADGYFWTEKFEGGIKSWTYSIDTPSKEKLSIVPIKTIEPYVTYSTQCKDVKTIKYVSVQQDRMVIKRMSVLSAIFD